FITRGGLWNRFLFPGLRLEYNQHHTALVQLCLWGGANGNERLTRFLGNLTDFRHRVPSRKTTAKPGTDQNVSFPYVGRIGHVHQIKLVSFTTPQKNGAQAIPNHFNWNRMTAIGD